MSVFVGNHHARQVFYLPFWSGKWWRGLLHEIRWTGFLEPAPKTYIRHNPLARLSILLHFLIPLIVQLLTGFALDAEGQGTDS